MKNSNVFSRLLAKRCPVPSHRKRTNFRCENLEGRLMFAGLTVSAGSLALIDAVSENTVADMSPAMIAEDTNDQDYVGNVVSNGSERIEDLAGGITAVTIEQEIDGVMVSRRFIIQAPDDLKAGKAYPVVFAFHGNGGIADGWTNIFADMVNDESFIGVYPQGYLNSWNLGSERSTADDVDFVDTIVENIARYRQIDLDKIFALGGSNGAGMCQLLAAETDHFRAVGAIATQMIIGNEPTEETPAISVIQIAGDEDLIIPYEGGDSPTGHVFYSAEESAALWAVHNGIRSNPVITSTTDGNVRFEWTGGEDGTSVVHYKMVGHGHGGFNEEEGGIHELVWGFFSSHLDESTRPVPGEEAPLPQPRPNSSQGGNNPTGHEGGPVGGTTNRPHHPHGPRLWGSHERRFRHPSSSQSQNRPGRHGADDFGMPSEEVWVTNSTLGRPKTFDQAVSGRFERVFRRDVQGSHHHNRAFEEMFSE